MLLENEFEQNIGESIIRKQLYVFAGLVLFIIAIYFETFFSMPEIWVRSDTFAHGFLILPISIYLIWSKREAFLFLKKGHNYGFALLLLLLVLGWLIADSVDVLVGKQLMVVLMLPVIVGAFWGAKVLKLFAFPLLYLLFAVPFGELFVPKLQEWTALIIVFGLELTGIPVFREALYISVPAGDFEVAVACSGVRYLIASLALGTLYAYLTYNKLYKRLLFILLAIFVPIVANGIRAYGIVMIAQLSEMKYATGVDHLIYGWLFFGIVIFMLFFIGNYWKDDIELENKDPGHSFNNTASANDGNKKIIISLTLLVLAIGPLSKNWLNSQTFSTPKNINLPDLTFVDWDLIDDKKINWKPTFHGSDQEIKGVYKKNEQQAEVFWAYYQSQTQGKELVNTTNSIFDQKKYKLLQKNKQQMRVAGELVKFDEYLLGQGSQKRLVLGWYYVFEKSMNNFVEIKINQAAGKITGLARDGSYVAFSMKYDEISVAREKLKKFISLAWPVLKKQMDKKHTQ